MYIKQLRKLMVIALLQIIPETGSIPVNISGLCGTTTIPKREITSNQGTRSISSDRRVDAKLKQFIPVKTF